MSGPTAYIVHRSGGRARLRIPQERGNDALFADLGRRLRGAPGVRAIETRPFTGSIVVEHDGDLEPVLARLRDQLDVRDTVHPHGTFQRIAVGFDEAERRLRAHVDGDVNLSTFAFYGLVAAGVYQIMQGKFLPAGETLLAHAISILSAHRKAAEDAPLKR